MACGINSYGPKVVWRLELHQHGSCRIQKILVLPLGNSILLRGISSGILMFDPRKKKSPSSWEPQEEGMMSIAANFPSVRNQGLSVQEKGKRLKVILASLVTSNKGAVYNTC
jgi:hypothetical protein